MFLSFSWTISATFRRTKKCLQEKKSDIDHKPSCVECSCYFSTHVPLNTWDWLIFDYILMKFERHNDVSVSVYYKNNMYQQIFLKDLLWICAGFAHQLGFGDKNWITEHKITTFHAELQKKVNTIFLQRKTKGNNNNKLLVCVLSCLSKKSLH